MRDLTEMYRLLQPDFQGKAHWALLDYIAVQLGIAGEAATPWIPRGVRGKLDELWDPESYTAIPEDHLGALLVFQRIKVAGKEFVPILPHTAREHVRLMGRLDPHTAYEVTPFGTGRIAMELTRNEAQAIYGIEDALLLYRIALINVHLFDIPAVVYYRHTSREPNMWNPLLRGKRSSSSDEEEV